MVPRTYILCLFGQNYSVYDSDYLELPKDFWFILVNCEEKERDRCGREEKK